MEGKTIEIGKWPHRSLTDGQKTVYHKLKERDKELI